MPPPAAFPLRRAIAALAVAGLLLLAAAGAGCAAAATTPNGSTLELPAGEAPMAFTTGIVTIHSAGGTHTLRVEVAHTGPQVQRGLMYRTALPEDAGMLFVYPHPHRGSFWMLNTLLPLSVAYADEQGVIFQVADLVPCGGLPEAECARRARPAQQPFRYALEVNQGYFARRDIRPGDRLVLEAGDP